ncbi:MAG TPA: cytochrome c-type biogenesis protein CcmH [Bryobacteraceae bacterium]|jgi:cytochrome c-type biogenesis protein CcmH/NrfF
MQKWKSSFLVALLGAVALAQSASEWDSSAVNNIAAKLHCSCGCKQDIACTMSPYPCPVCKMNKMRIYNMLSQGMTEPQILDTYVKEEGKDVLEVRYGAEGLIGPIAAIIGGFALVIVVIRRMRKQTAAVPAGPPVDPEMLARIEKDLSKLD